MGSRRFRHHGYGTDTADQFCCPWHHSRALTGPAAGAATIGCCCQMVGFAVASFRENGVGGLLAQGIGTSMLQVPNIIRHPQIWIPEILSSAILGPIAISRFDWHDQQCHRKRYGYIRPGRTDHDMADNDGR